MTLGSPFGFNGFSPEWSTSEAQLSRASVTGTGAPEQVRGVDLQPLPDLPRLRLFRERGDTSAAENMARSCLCSLALWERAACFGAFI